MSAYVFFAYIALPLIVGAIGTLAAYIHVRADGARQRDDARKSKSA